MAGKLPTAIAEEVYQVLEKFADAKPDYYSKEEFIFHFGVLKGKSIDFKLSCFDGAARTFYCTDDGRMWMTGKGSGRVNRILDKIASSSIQQIGEFTVTRHGA